MRICGDLRFDGDVVNVRAAGRQFGNQMHTDCFICKRCAACDLKPDNQTDCIIRNRDILVVFRNGEMIIP